MSTTPPQPPSQDPPSGGYQNPPPGGYQGPPGGYQGPPSSGGGNRTGLILGIIALVLFLGAAAVIVPRLLGDDEGEDVAGETFLEPGEIFLQPASDPGPDPFTASVGATPPETLAQPVTAEETEIPAPENVQVAADSGAQPGLFGGTQDAAACDGEQMIRFLDENPDKGQAWVNAQTADANLQWVDGPLTSANRADYIRHLTPVFLTADTRVTNHGFRGGSAFQIPMVLQKGTAVLVDAYGVPRARCACGNPLISPIASPQTPTYVGRPWPDFQPGQIRIVSPPPDPVTVFVVTDPNTGQQFNLPPGVTVTTQTPTATPTPTATATATSAPLPPAPTVPAASPGHSILFAPGDAFFGEVPDGLTTDSRLGNVTGNPSISYSIGPDTSTFAVPSASVVLPPPGTTGFSEVADAFATDAYFQDRRCEIVTEPFSTPGGLTGEVRKVQNCPGLAGGDDGMDPPPGFARWSGYVVGPTGRTLHFGLEKGPGGDLEAELLNTLDTVRIP